MTNLADTVEKYLSETGMTPTAFGLAVMGNPQFVFDLRRGRGWSNRTFDKVTDHIRSNPAAKTSEGAE